MSYKVEFLEDISEADLEQRLNKREAEGYKLHSFVQMLRETEDEICVWTTLVFEREQQPEKYTLLSDEMALDWTTVQPDHGDSILKREMAAARDDARPVVDPLKEGLTR